MPQSIEESPSSLQTIRFTNLGDLIRAIDAAPGDALRVTNVSPAVFKGLDEGYETHKIRLSVYNEDCQCLMITVSTQVHEELGGTLYGQLYYHIFRMGLGQRWAYKGHATFYNTRHPTRSAGAKQADSSGGPREGRPRPRWPTIVFDAGYSQTLKDMKAKARAWFTDSDHKVKVVILSKLVPDQRTLIIERWEESQDEGLVQVPGCQQRITIAGSWTNPSAYQAVESSDLILSFQLLFLRDPGPGEGDVIIPISWIEVHAQQVWETWDEVNEESGEWLEGRCTMLEP
ncbi:hypothetical protein J3E68DRAFT_392457 [Trichoderma sp. SZMC 28012]